MNRELGLLDAVPPFTRTFTQPAVAAFGLVMAFALGVLAFALRGLLGTDTLEDS